MLKKFKTIHQETIQTRADLSICQTFPLFLEAFLLCSKELKSHWTGQKTQEQAQVFNTVIRKFA